jgi:hypothetical protein
MELIPVASPLLARRLRSRLWCQKQAGIPHRGRSQKNMNRLFKRYFHISLLALFACAASDLLAEDLTDRELRATFASLNKQYLQDLLQWNPDLALYSLVPLQKSTDNTRVFEATFVNVGGKQQTFPFIYVRVNNVWHRRTHITDDSAIKQNNK